ncbi:MAG TPA: FtsX-like permease family protein [Gammaproteobacteria bacterium]|nr:FtsX-like permease family protein [Gammaproteobacteria bacterium]
MRVFRLAWRQLRRERRSGALTILIASLVVAAAAVSTVGFLTSRVSQAMRVAANATLAADVDVRGPTALPDRYTEFAHQRDLKTTTMLRFPSVVLKDDLSQLAELHAVENGFPLRGEVQLSKEPFGPAHRADGIPAPGTIWAAPRLLTALRAAVGDTVQIGAADFRIAAVLAYAPGQGIDFIEFAPNLYLNAADLAATKLVQPGSRIGYHLLVAGPPAAVADYKTALKSELRPSDRVVDISDTRPEVNDPLHQAQSFLRLAALVSVLIAAVAVAMSARQYAVRRTDLVAVLLTLGMTRGRLVILLILQLLLLAVASAVIGSAIGYGAQTGLVLLLGDALPVALPPPGWIPALTAFGTVILLLAGFALAPVLRLRNTPPARILRRDLGPRPGNVLAIWSFALAALIALLAWQVNDWRITLYVFAALIGAGLVLALGSGAALLALRPLRTHVGTAWRFGLGNLWRRGGLSVLQVTAFGLGLTVLLWLTLVRADVFRAWQEMLPPSAPNEFIFNIQPAQRDDLNDFLSKHDLPTPRLYPMTRARLVGINGQHVTAADFKKDRARHLLNRQANLSMASFRRQENVMTAGQWWDKSDYGSRLVSVDAEIAQVFDVGPGDTLTFAISGDELTLEIANLRNIRWQSFEPNFYFVTPPGVLNRYPTTYITSLHLSPQKAPLLADLARALPGITVVDIGAIIRSVRQIITQASLAVAYVFAFTVFAGVLVLLAAIQATRDERRYESALLRTLGAGRAAVLKGIVAEFAMLGLLAGGLGGAAALGAGWLLISQVFDLPYHADPWIIPAGLVGGAIIVIGTGVAATRRAVNRPPVETLTRG